MKIVKEQLGGTWVYPLHRLDRPTSGVLMFGLARCVLIGSCQVGHGCIRCIAWIWAVAVRCGQGWGAGQEGGGIWLHPSGILLSALH